MCCGKTTLLSIAAFVLKKVFKKILKHSTISPDTFTQGELQGNLEEGSAYYSNEASLYESIFSMIIRGYKECEESDSSSEIIKTIVFDADVHESWSEWIIRFVLDTSDSS